MSTRLTCICLFALIGLVAHTSTARADTISHIACDYCTDVAQLESAVTSYLSGSHYYNGQLISYGPSTPPGTRVYVTSSVVRISGEYRFEGMAQSCSEFLGCVWYPVITSLTTSNEAAVQLDRQLLGRTKTIPPFQIPPGNGMSLGTVTDISTPEMFQNYVASVFPRGPGGISWWGFDGWIPRIGLNVELIDSRTGERFRMWDGDIIKFIFPDGSSIEVRMNIESLVSQTTHWRIVDGSERGANGCPLNAPNCQAGQAQNVFFPSTGGGISIVEGWAGLPGGSFSIQSLIGQALCEAKWVICIQHQAGISCINSFSRC